MAFVTQKHEISLSVSYETLSAAINSQFKALKGQNATL